MSTSRSTQALLPPLPRGLSIEVPGFRPITPQELERYRRNNKMERSREPSFTIKPIETNFPGPVAEGSWTPYIHPEGVLYFYNESQAIPVITEVCIYDAKLRQLLESRVQDVLNYIRRYNIRMPSDIGLVLEYDRGSGKYGYYFVDNSPECLFWLDDYDATSLLGCVKVEYTRSHIRPSHFCIAGLKRLLTTSFTRSRNEIDLLLAVDNLMPSLIFLRLHRFYYPDVLPLSPANICEVKEILIFAIGESFTTPTSVAAYDSNTLQTILALVKDIEGKPNIGSGPSAMIYHEKYVNLHGEPGVRLSANQSIHPDQRDTFFIKILSPIFLFGPRTHLRQLKEICVDSLVAQRHWKLLLEQLIKEWKECTLSAAVLLNANLAFLTIRSVEDSGPHGQTSYTQRFSYYSIMSNVGGIVLGTLLVWKHDGRKHPQSVFFISRNNSKLWLETLALTYSLPYALLMWG
ncbi:LOW QUALITY PROTEIN: hypothetical protein CVT26_006407 [Gymnopilus dilepis]|uniref:WW domain-containing protein n=1 Tax=Gymnopilus dilepis TaxID=231916 RepID=A0A409Y1Z8_9AGAR|nr:LOW QUALITY PROTEIN: hypothetical protein CVT26_006407 [Gymnopilus dilepis]